jgi:hypothetical protein
MQTQTQTRVRAQAQAQMKTQTPTRMQMQTQARVQTQTQTQVRPREGAGSHGGGPMLHRALGAQALSGGPGGRLEAGGGWARRRTCRQERTEARASCAV